MTDPAPTLDTSVRYGDLWVNDQGSAFACIDSSAHVPVVARLVEAYGPVNLTYVDLPYNQALLTNFRNKAGLPYQTYTDFLDRMVSVLLMTSGAVHLETGISTIEQVLALAFPRGLMLDQQWTISYDRGKPAALARLRPHGHGSSFPDLPSLTGIDDQAIPRLVMEKTPDARVVSDWCVGLGCTSWAAANTGRRFVGAEISPDRMQRSMRDFAKRTRTTFRCQGTVIP